MIMTMETWKASKDGEFYGLADSSQSIEHSIDSIRADGSYKERNLFSSHRGPFTEFIKITKEKKIVITVESTVVGLEVYSNQVHKVSEEEKNWIYKKSKDFRRTGRE